MGRYFEFELKKNLILILARGGSKTISRLNLRLVNEKPLLYYVLQSALKSNLGDVFVSTDSDEIRELTNLYGGKTIPRPKYLTKDDSKIKDIARYCLTYLKKKKLDYEKCLIVSPVFPLLKISTMRKFFNALSTKRTIFGIITDDNNYYEIENNRTAEISKLNTKIVRVKKILSFQVESFLKTGKFQPPIYGIKLENEEAMSINNYHDLSALEKTLRRKRILVRVDADQKIGLGHVYNMLTVLNHLRDEEILIVMNSTKSLGDYKFKEHNYKIKYFSSNDELLNIILSFKPHIVFNDILNTNKSYIQKLKKIGCFVVNFEDLGHGSNYADLVFNPIYYSAVKNKNKLFGSKYACVRDEFRIWPLKTEIRKEVKQILITFGGTDPSNITTQILKIFFNNNFLKKINLVIVLGVGHVHKNEIYQLVTKMREDGFPIKIIERSDIMAKHISESDFVITSNGRTVFEVASLRVPMITISANPREDLHLFSKYSGGAIPLNFGYKMDDKKVVRIIQKMIKYKTRKKLVNSLSKYDLLAGVHDIIDTINKKYGMFSKKSFN